MILAIPRATISQALPDFTYGSLCTLECVIYQGVIWTLTRCAKQGTISGTPEELASVLPEHIWRDLFREAGVSYEPLTPVEQAEQREIQAVHELGRQLR